MISRLIDLLIVASAIVCIGYLTSVLSSLMAIPFEHEIVSDMSIHILNLKITISTKEPKLFAFVYFSTLGTTVFALYMVLKKAFVEVLIKYSDKN